MATLAMGASCNTASLVHVQTTAATQTQSFPGKPPRDKHQLGLSGGAAPVLHCLNSVEVFRLAVAGMRSGTRSTGVHKACWCATGFSFTTEPQ